MKKFLLLAALAVMATATFAGETADTTVTNKNDGQYYQAAPMRSTTKSSGSAGISPITGTIITIQGQAPYAKQPKQDPDKAFWPRFNIQVGAGYAYKYFTVEGVVEYMQANVRPKEEKAEYYNYILGSARVGAMLPISVTDKFLIIPNVKGQFGGAFYIGSGISSRFMAGVIGGLDFGIRMGKSSMFTIGFVYEYRWFVDRSTTVDLGMMGGQIAFVF